MALSKVEPLKSINSLPDNDFSLMSAIGNTPVVELQHLNPNPRVRLLAKLEGNNPGGSVKDRTAWWMIRRVENEGVCKLARRSMNRPGQYRHLPGNDCCRQGILD